MTIIIGYFQLRYSSVTLDWSPGPDKHFTICVDFDNISSDFVWLGRPKQWL